MNIIVSTRSIFSILLLLASVWIFWQVKEIFLLFFVSLILSLALLPFIEKLERRGLSRSLSAVVVYFSLIVVFALVVGSGVSPMVEQTTLFFSHLPKIIESVLSNPQVSSVSRQLIEEVTRQLASASISVVKITLGIFGSFLSLVTILVFSFYFSLDYENLSNRFVSFFSDGTKRTINEALEEIEKRLGSWVRGEFVLMIVIAALSYIGLSLLGVNYALPLSLIAGVLEIVPVIGPVISAIPAVIVGFAGSTALGLGVLALYILIQQFENNIIVPRVMKKAVGFNPLLTMGAIFVGGKMFGVVGALLAVPVVLILQVIIPKFFLEKR